HGPAGRDPHHDPGPRPPWARPPRRPARRRPGRARRRAREPAGGQRPRDRAEWVPAGATVRVGQPRSGVRSYVAVAGGIAVEPVLGSRSTDTLAGVGPPVVEIGASLPLAGADSSHRSHD